MNILYLSQGNYPEYQGDLLFLGLRKLLGESVVDAPKISILYEETFRDNPESKRKIPEKHRSSDYAIMVLMLTF